MAEKGMVFDRYGSRYGEYVSDIGTPTPMRSLSPTTDLEYKLQIEVLNPFPMERSLIAPAFGQPGLGVQYRTPISIKHLEELGYIKFY